VELALPGELTIFDIRWFSIYDTTNKRDLGHIIIPGLGWVPNSSSLNYFRLFCCFEVSNFCICKNGFLCRVARFF
jgi:hypothetical protein